MPKGDLIRIQVWTGRFLGTRTKGEQLIQLLHSLDGGIWLPDKWDHFEPVRRIYSAASKEDILSALSEERDGSISNNVNFLKSRPYASFSLSVWRSQVTFMNRMYVDLDAKEFSQSDGPTRIRAIVADLVKWSDAVFASARHSKQKHWRVAQRTPRERIQEMDWLTFFGKPYVDLFGGRERILRSPCESIEELSDGLMLIAAERPDSPEMTDSDRVLIGLEEYLGADSFAGRGYPQVPCRVPAFDLSETVIST
jgi:hypothetical protein